MVASTEKCDHSGSKKGIFITGSSHEGLTQTEHVYICHECKAIYLHRYRHDAAAGEERTDIIMPGEVKGGVKFHNATADLIQLVHDAIGKAELVVIDKQATAVHNYAVDRLEQIEHERQDEQATAIRNYAVDRLEQIEHERQERECNGED